MASFVNLDAMIPRADFCEADNEAQAEKIVSLPLSQLLKDSFLVPSLRKPDFQRETNQWSPSQIVTFVKSFLDNELVPSIILWRSPGKIFVIDGAHRVSAIMAWIRDDYGDGTLSKKFYGGAISKEQLKIANTTRKFVNSEIGSYKVVEEIMRDATLAGSDAILGSRADNAKTRSLTLQWVEGDAIKAETSFFKINKQGTPLNPIEEKLLRNRNKPIAIGARSIVRAGTGHKYWSNFPADDVKEIERLAKDLHDSLFSPELEHPIKSLNLPHAGRASPIQAYSLMMDFISYASGASLKDTTGPLFDTDVDGKKTGESLACCLKVVRRITGNESSSLGLHPAVYFYNEHGKHIDTVFLAVVNLFSSKLRNNNDHFFRQFTERRRFIEKIFLENKPLINQANQAIHSAHRVLKWSDLIEKSVKGEIFKDGFSQLELLDELGLKGKIIASNIREIGTNFSDSTKSAIYLSKSVEFALQCPLCGGLIDADKAMSYDHVLGKASGGTGDIENGQITHPYCNSIKN